MAIFINWKNAVLRNRRYLPIIFILLLASFLRLYRINDYMTFLGDEGRDAIVWLKMVRDHKFTLIGPTTSIGNMYLGPLYYYLMLPFYFVFGSSPVGPSIGVALFSTATVFFIWYVGKIWFNEKTGLIAAFFYTISPVVLYHSRSSWNPNIMPFFALLCIYGVWKFWQQHQYFWLLIVGIGFSFVVQSHYLGLLLFPTICLFWILTLYSLIKTKKSTKKFFLFSLFATLIFSLLTILPLVWFDLRHGFLNYHAFQKFFGDRQTTVNFKIYKALPNFWPLWEKIVNDVLAGQNFLLGRFLAIGFVIAAIIKRNVVFKNNNFLLTITWLFFGLLGLGLYKQHIYDHYFGFLFPVIFLFLGYFLTLLFNWGLVGRWLGGFIFLILLIVNLQLNYLRTAPNYQYQRTQEIDQMILKEAKNKPFNFALLAQRNYDAGYTYFFQYWKSNIVFVDPQKADETITDQLFVVCEDKICEPLANPKAEIAMFGWAKIENEWQFPWGVRVFKLIHQK